MKEYYFDLILLVSLVGLLIFYEANRFMKRGKILIRMSYDNKRFLIGLPLVPNILSELRYFSEQSEHANSFKNTGLMTIDEFTAFSRELSTDTSITIGILLLVTAVLMITDYRTFGVINKKGIYLHRFIKFDSIEKYHVDKEFCFIEICYKTLFKKDKQRYLKMDMNELMKVSSILSTYVKQDNNIVEDDSAYYV